jgi:alkylated DNA repair protein (DNA oxidative demethylase)
MTYSLFDAPEVAPWNEAVCPGAVILRGFALRDAAAIMAAVQETTRLAPFRRMQTPNGFQMSVAMSNCGQYGWVSDRSGYRYDRLDPASGLPWPTMPTLLLDLAARAAQAAGFPAFRPDACLINAYEAGARLSLHQDKDERDFAQPIVSVSLGIPANFQFGGLLRSDKTIKIQLSHGDVAVWGGRARLNFHGILPIKAEHHPLTGNRRINLTFRKVR